MAYEPRYAIGFIGSSGAGGAALARRNWGEKLENVAGSGEYHWMAGNYIKYAADPLGPNDLPVDAHELIALAAPRPLFIGAGTLEQGDGWVDPKGMFMAAAAAGPVYRLLGKKDLGTTRVPAGRNAAHRRRPCIPPAFRRPHVGAELADLPGFRRALLQNAGLAFGNTVLAVLVARSRVCRMPPGTYSTSPTSCRLRDARPGAASGCRDTSRRVSRRW